MSDDEYRNELSPPSHRAVRLTTPGTSSFAPVLRRPDPGGMFNSRVVRWRAQSQARALKALADRSYAEAEYFDAQVQLIDSYIKAASAADTLRELPDILALDRARRRADRAEEHREITYGRALAKHRRAAELARTELEALRAQHVLRQQRGLNELDSELDAKFFYDEPASASRDTSSMTDDPIPDEEHVLMAAKILRKRRTTTAASPGARLRYR